MLLEACNIFIWTQKETLNVRLFVKKNCDYVNASMLMCPRCVQIKKKIVTGKTDQLFH